MLLFSIKQVVVGIIPASGTSVVVDTLTSVAIGLDAVQVQGGQAGAAVRIDVAVLSASETYTVRACSQGNRV